jgi:ABC-type uncharacterized transport system auxiliary subunit
MKKILLLLCFLLCACSAQTDIKDYTVIYKNKEVYPGVSASKKDIYYYDNLKWTPTLYYIKRGKIVSTYQYLDEEYHSSSEKDKIKKKKQFDHEAENFIKNFKN